MVPLAGCSGGAHNNYAIIILIYRSLYEKPTFIMFCFVSFFQEALQELEELKQIVPKESLVYFLIGKVNHLLIQTWAEAGFGFTKAFFRSRLWLPRFLRTWLRLLHFNFQRLRLLGLPTIRLCNQPF